MSSFCFTQGGISVLGVDMLLASSSCMAQKPDEEMLSSGDAC